VDAALVISITAMVIAVVSMSIAVLGWWRD
jgi:hypothetical protein